MKLFIVIGGGAAGYFAAINAAERYPDLKVIILETSGKVLQKVKVSGGGRCNITNACFEPKELVAYYPRGQKELLGPFHQFATGDIIDWFEKRGVPLKIEADNRIFPKSNTSQSIIDCFLGQADKFGVELYTNYSVNAIKKQGDLFEVTTSQQTYIANYVLIATGSASKMFPIIESLGHTIIPSVPSLFTFNITDQRLKDNMGLSVPYGRVKVQSTKLEAQGPVLITHWGLSGPAILKLSAWGALKLNQKNYRFNVEVNWLNKKPNTVFNMLTSYKKVNPKKQIALHCPFNTLPKRLWKQLVEIIQIPSPSTWAQLSHRQQQKLSQQLTQSIFKVTNAY